MDETKLSPELRQAIEDWFEGFELVEFLQISIQDVINNCEDILLENLEEIKEEIRWKDFEDDGEGSERGD